MTDDTNQQPGRTDATTAHDETDDTECDGDNIADALTTYATPLTATDLSAPSGALATLDDRLRNARVVGLGEATHGTRECFQVKRRFIEHLVTTRDCRAVALEANFSEALALNDYVVHGSGDPRDALWGVYFWTWQVESVLALLEWLREFNADRRREDRVRFHGVDAQFTQGAVDALRDFLADADPPYLESIRGGLATIADEGVHPLGDDNLDARVDAAENLVPALRDRIDERAAEYAAATTRRDVDLARQHARVLAQATEFKDGFRGDPDSEAVEARLAARDRAMADNVEWVLDTEPTDCVAVWAHDAHVNRVHQQSRHTDHVAPSLGRFLADRHGDAYYAVGFAFGRGAFQAMTESENGYELREHTLYRPLPDTVEATLDGLPYAEALLDLRAASDDPRLGEWLAAPKRQFSVGATYDGDLESYVTRYAYADAFDALCWLAETTRARPLAD